MKTLFFLPFLCLALFTFSCDREDGSGPTIVTFLDAEKRMIKSGEIDATGATELTFFIEVNNVDGWVNVEEGISLSVDNGVSGELPHQFVSRRSAVVTSDQTNRLLGITLPVGTDDRFRDAETAFVTLQLQDRNSGGNISRELMIKLD